MSEDILANWKTKKFILADSSLIDEEGFIIILTDVKYWAENIDELILWCKSNGGTVRGMSVSFDSEKQLLLFTLRWA